MLALLLAWATLGITSGPAKETTAKPAVAAASREWTDASGTKRVQAVLLRVEGEKLWLRRPDGKLATTTVSQLSRADRQYVATNPVRNTNSSEPEPKPPTITTEIVRQIGSKVQSMAELPTWTQGSQLEGRDRLVPAALVYIRISRQFLEDYAERAVRRKKPVTDYILGARIEGESETKGKTTLELLPGNGRLLGKIVFEGTVHAKTRGHKSPVVLHQVSDSTFRSTKLISMDESGLHVSRATTDAPTNLTTTSIDSTLPRLRGRIARRIAWNRVGDAHRQAESITADHTAATISRDFDERIDQSVAKVREVFKSKIPELDSEHRTVRTEMRFRSCADCVEVAMIRREANDEERKLRPPVVEGNPHVAVRLHRAMLTRAMEDPEIRSDLAPLFVKLLEARFGRDKNASSKVDKDSPTDTSKWAFDLDWLALDFMDSAS